MKKKIIRNLIKKIIFWGISTSLVFSVFVVAAKAAPTPAPSVNDLSAAWQTYVTPVAPTPAPAPAPAPAPTTTSTPVSKPPVTVRSSSLSESQITALILKVINRPDVQEKLRGPQGLPGPQGPAGMNGTTPTSGGSYTNPIAYFPVGVTTPNSTANFS